MYRNSISRRQSRRIPLKIAGIYTAIGAAWILLSDRALAVLVADPHLATRLQTYKGWFYVLATSALLYLLVRRHTRALGTQFEEIRTIFDSLNAIVYVADLETHELLHLNRLGEELSGTREWQGKNCFEVLQTSQPGPCGFCTNTHLESSGQARTPYTWVFRNTRNQRWYQCIDKAIPWSDGRLVRLEIAIDITENRELEEIKDQMLSSVSHEMRTPLTALLGFTEFMLEQETTANERRGYLEAMQREGQRLSRLIDNFLRLGRLKSRRETLHRERLTPWKLLAPLAKKYAQASPRHPLRLAIAPEAGPFWGEAEDLTLVFDNLLANAFQYSPEGGEIVLGAEPRGKEVVLWVKDSGIGLEPENLERVFDQFYRVDNTDRRRTSGVGLGLALSREIVLRHQGRIWAESSPGAGSTFFVALPEAAQVSSPSEPKSPHQAD
ncbi:ATP-binding protein [Trichloromonas sp.]|uniref:ATP-binding protein n=1 Tax=Trichloromonas sp. TaxID=3069249 RepID=UPI002A4286BB|nr:ATP-binding protein [Trichloromonas sp.]